MDYFGGYIIHLSSGIAGFTAAYWVGPRSRKDGELNTNICAATSLLVWRLDVIFFKKPSVIGAVQGMITGLVCITPGAGLVQGWAAIVFSSIGKRSMVYHVIVHKRWTLLQHIDDALGVFHTYIAGLLGSSLTAINVVIPLRMMEEQLMIGDDGMYCDDTSHNKASTGAKVFNTT
ncbi:Ammonium transporter 3 member 2 [Hibiscus syriacus]|uniref:Ammonium transporter 3 member 2 n=1 Tax=Hibiscus syriacus TaxID=106335 RepID=A0A6A2ZU67_HIBSY|nr:Ammonium transporter 3 member 2 [Hibiscus syriacus]